MSGYGHLDVEIPYIRTQSCVFFISVQIFEINNFNITHNKIVYVNWSICHAWIIKMTQKNKKKIKVFFIILKLCILIIIINISKNYYYIIRFKKIYLNKLMITSIVYCSSSLINKIYVKNSNLRKRDKLWKG